VAVFSHPALAYEPDVRTLAVPFLFLGKTNTSAHCGYNIERQKQGFFSP
jgi:hypothetical protein